MSDLLENELIRKYFGEENGTTIARCCKALRILQAMQEPIKKGDKVLIVNAGIYEAEAMADQESWDTYHPNRLRLPSRFQPSKCVGPTCSVCPEHDTCVHNCADKTHLHPAQDAVEEPITGEYSIGSQKIVFTPNHTIIFKRKGLDRAGRK